MMARLMRHQPRFLRHPSRLARYQPEFMRHPREGRVARAIEEQTTKISSDVFLWAAGVSIVGALALYLTGRERDGIFVGHWSSTLLLLGLYNKLVRLLGSE